MVASFDRSGTVRNVINIFVNIQKSLIFISQMCSEIGSLNAVLYRSSVFIRFAMNRIITLCPCPVITADV